MAMFAIIVFFGSIAGILGLFFVKALEEKKGLIFAPIMRGQLDQSAIELKLILIQLQNEFKKLGPTSARFTRIALHQIALSLAALSRSSERQAQKLADMVSHKRHFERREPKNEFLHKVSSAKNGRSTKKGPTDEVDL